MLRWAKLRGAKLRGAKLRGTKLRWAVLTIAAFSLMASEAPDLRPLFPGGKEAPARTEEDPARRLLKALSAGDVAALAEADLELFLNPPFLPDGVDPALQRPWITFIPEALRRHDGDSRERLLAALDAAWLRSGGETQTARAFLPGPQAAAAVQFARNRNWDRGQIAAFISADPAFFIARPAAHSAAHSAANAGVSSPAPDPRVVFAAQLLGRDQPLRVFGPSISTRYRDRPRTWATINGWLLAPPDAGGWRRGIAPGSLVISNRDSVIIANAGETRWIGLDGRSLILPQMPDRVRPVGVSASAAWFSDGERAWRVTRSGAVEVIPLPEPAIDRPLVDGDRSVWVGRRRVWLFAGSSEIGQWWHGHEAVNGLAWIEVDGDANPQPAIRTSGGMKALLQPQPHDVESLLRSGAGTVAITRDPTNPRAWLGDPVQARAHPDRARAATAGALADQVIVRALLISNRVNRAEDQDFIRTQARLQADLAVPGSAPASVDWPFPSAWPHARSGLNWTTTGAAIVGSHWGSVSANNRMQPSVSSTTGAAVIDLASGSLRLERDDRWFELTASSNDKRWLWIRRWRGVSELAAPATTVWSSQGIAWVAEGDRRISAFDRATGNSVATWETALGDRFADEAVWCRAGVAVAGKDALGWRIRWPLSGTVTRLDSEPAWLVPGGDGAWVADSASRLWWVTPSATTASASADRDRVAAGRRPEITAQGLERDGFFWPWMDAPAEP